MRLSEELRRLFPSRDTIYLNTEGKEVNPNTLIAQACHLEQQSARVEEVEFKLRERRFTEVHSAYPASAK